MSSPAAAARRRTLRGAAAGRSRSGAEHLRLTTLVLDMGGVVVPSLFEARCATDLPPGPFAPAGRADAAWAEVEAGRTQEREYWAALARARPDVDLAACVRTGLRVRPEVGRLLADLGGRLRLAALTNDMAHWFGPDWPHHFPELLGFDRLLEASRSGALKPDPGVFRWALGVLGERAERCLFVDDLPANLTGAATVGMATQHFDVTDPVASVAALLARVGVAPAAAAPTVFRLPATTTRRAVR